MVNTARPGVKTASVTAVVECRLMVIVTTLFVAAGLDDKQGGLVLAIAC